MSEPINPVDGGAPVSDDPTATVEMTDRSPNFRVTEGGFTRVTENDAAIELE